MEKTASLYAKLKGEKVDEDLTDARVIALH
jgi:hypothetical protein